MQLELVFKLASKYRRYRHFSLTYLSGSILCCNQSRSHSTASIYGESHASIKYV